MEMPAEAVSTDTDINYLEGAIRIACSQIAASMREQARHAAKSVASMFRPGIDDGVTW